MTTSFKRREKSVEHLAIPYGDGIIEIKSPPRDLGVFIMRLRDAQMKHAAGGVLSDEDWERINSTLNDDQQREFEESLLGDAYDLICAETASSFEDYRLFIDTVVYWVLSGGGKAGRDAAADYWNTGGHPKAPRQPTDRKPKAKRTR
jgi:hypothetical protein